MNSIENLLNQVKLLNFKYEKVFEEYQYHFNIFSILMKDSDEVNLHSKFIYELLNPEGSHKQKEIFLKLFLNELDIDDFDLEDVVIYREYKNIDILIKNRNQVIIIENKIYTQDHSNQLSKYFNMIKDEGFKEENIKIIYLTLYGEEPNEEDIENLILASYQDTILNWLENSIKEMAIYPTIRETLFQYQNLIKKLTNQSENRGYIMEIKDLLLKGNNLKLALNIEEALVEAKIEIQYNFWIDLQEELKSRGLEFEFVDDKYNTIYIKKRVENFYKGSQNKRYFGLKMDIENINKDDKLTFFIEIGWNIYYGFGISRSNIRKRIVNEVIFDNIFKKIENLSNWEKVRTKNNYWLGWKFPTKKFDFQRFHSQEIFDLANKTKRKEYIVELTNEIEQIIGNYKSPKR